MTRYVSFTVSHLLPENVIPLNRHAARLIPVTGIAHGGSLDLLDFDVERQDAVGNLARGHAEQTSGASLDPTGVFERGDDARALVEVGGIWMVISGIGR